MTTSHEPSRPLTESEQLEAIHLPKALRKQLVRHIMAAPFGEIGLVIDKFRVKFVKRTESERAEYDC